jgi:antitoxin component YwqK of YwqJK toxin-antitoxin module
MNLKLIILFLIFLSQDIYSQHSDTFVKLTKNIIPTDSLTINKKFKNGNQKEIGKIYEYEIEGYIYSNYAGKQIGYYRNGSIAYEYEYDDFGCLLSCKSYDGQNNLWNESLTIKIDSNATGTNDFFEDDNHLTIIMDEKVYRYDNEKCDYYLKKQGQRINGKKNGVWKTFYVDGTVKKKDLY